MQPKPPNESIPNLYKRARQLRQEMTPAEAILWKHLRNRRFGGYKFRRQQPIDYYVADFFCAAARLIIELDGDSHMGKEERDAQRQTYIESHNLQIIRFWNFEVYDELEWVLDSIDLTLTAQLASSHELNARQTKNPSPGGEAPPPARGEGKAATFHEP